MALLPIPPKDYVFNIAQSGLTIYSSIEVGDTNFWIPTPELEALLNAGLENISLKGLALRTRSKIVKTRICEALGYPSPRSFKKVQPRFPGQDFDVYIQKANNLQIWNEEITPTRRYVLVRVTDDDLIVKVKVVTGEDLARLDTTGTLTQKFQARLSFGASDKELVAVQDTDNLRPVVLAAGFPANFVTPPINYPTEDSLLPIQEVFTRLAVLVGEQFAAVGHDQERNRGSELHRLVCKALGYQSYHDDGRFPDLRHQLVEVKLQTSPTIDLGLVRPDSTAKLDVPQIHGVPVRHCDVRYAIFYGVNDGVTVRLTHFFLTTGEAFFSRFTQFQGKVVNKKLQILLPRNFFDGNTEGLPG